jgi:hypothetical protein
VKFKKTPNIILLQNFVGTTVANAPLTKLYKPDQSISAVSAHFCNFHIKGGISLKRLDQMCVFLGYMQIHKYAFIVKYAFIAKYAIICIIKMMLFYLESSEAPKKL